MPLSLSSSHHQLKKAHWTYKYSLYLSSLFLPALFIVFNRFLQQFYFMFVHLFNLFYHSPLLVRCQILTHLLSCLLSLYHPFVSFLNLHAFLFLCCLAFLSNVSWCTLLSMSATTISLMPFCFLRILRTPQVLLLLRQILYIGFSRQILLCGTFL